MGTPLFLAKPGYGLTVEEGRKGLLVGVLIVDRPKSADPEWLLRIEKATGEYQLEKMAKSGERDILCQMLVEPESVQYLSKYSFDQSTAIKMALDPLLDYPPKPTFYMKWNEEIRLWESQIAYPNELPRVIREVFEQTGYGCLAVESTLGVVHVCHSSD